MKNLHSSLLNKKKFLWVTLIEMMLMLTIITIALSTMFVVLTQSINFSYDSESRIKAVNIAREWIEAITNIRNTNWLRYSSDRKNCWDTKNYNHECFGWNSNSKINTWEYILTNNHGAWELETYTNENKWPVYIDKNGWYIQYSNKNAEKPNKTCKNIENKTNNISSQDCKTIYDRKIKIERGDEDGKNNINITVEVTWRNSFGKRTVNLTSTLTNWKSNFDNY